MKGSTTRFTWFKVGFLLLALTMVFTVTGCQYEVGGQMLPSPYYTFDDVQYFPPGPEFRHAREAAAIAEATQEEALIGQ